MGFVGMWVPANGGNTISFKSAVLINIIFQVIKERQISRAIRGQDPGASISEDKQDLGEYKSSVLYEKEWV